MKKFVLYERKSKEDKTKLVSHTYATQEWIVDNFLKTQGEEGVDWIIVERFAETISGGGYYTKRPLFSKAVSMCKKDKTLTLLASKPDRITRNLRTATELMETLNMTLATCPDASELELHMVFMMAQNEYKIISDRFIAMHQAKKSRGEPVGSASPNYTRTKRDKMNRATSGKALTHAEQYRSQLEVLVASPVRLTLQKLADSLNNVGARTLKGGMYNPSTVKNLAKYLDVQL